MALMEMWSLMETWMDQVKRFSEHGRRPQGSQGMVTSAAPKRAVLRCEICHSEDVRFVSGGKYRCLTCGYLPS